MNYYDSIAKGYNSLYMSEQIKKFENIKDLIPKKGLILELGCGTGFITEKIKNIIGVDYSIGMLKVCPKNLRVVCADSSKLPFKCKVFDLVFSLTVLQDVNDLKSAISEIKRVLKPDGKILLSVLNKNRINEARKLLKKEFKKIKEKENYNDVVFFTQ
ncbi:MAG: class I SAM-dependent methyltransferase [Candidatus Nanoarchaeia archaeon]|jgi:ubiquinone/menaquinone biosynthesis C-methylase UbiE